MTTIFVDILEERDVVESELLLDECDVIEDEDFIDDEGEYDQEEELINHMSADCNNTEEPYLSPSCSSSQQSIQPSQHHINIDAADGMVVTSQTCTASQPFDVVQEQNNYLTICGKIGYFKVLDPLRKCACFIGLNTKLSKATQKQVVSEAILHTRTIHNDNIEIKLFRLVRPIIMSQEDLSTDHECVRPCAVGEATFMYFTNRDYLQVEVGEYRMGSCMTGFYTPTDKVHIPKLTDLALTLECQSASDLYNLCHMIAKGAVNTKFPITFNPKKHDLPNIIKVHRYNCWLSLHVTNRKIYEHIVDDAQKQRSLLNKTISRRYYIQKIIYYIVGTIIRQKFSKATSNQYIEDIIKSCSMTALSPGAIKIIVTYAASRCTKLDRVIDKQPAIAKVIIRFVNMFVAQQHKKNCIALIGDSGSGKTYLATKLNEMVAGHICNVNEGSAEYKISAALKDRPKCVLLDDVKENGILSLRNRLSMIDGTYAQINVKWGSVGSVESSDIPFFLMTLNDVQRLLRRSSEDIASYSRESTEENKILLSRIELVEFSGFVVPSKAKRYAYSTDDLLYFIVAVIGARLLHGTYEYSNCFDKYLPYSTDIDVSSMLQYPSSPQCIECTQSVHIGSHTIDVGIDIVELLCGPEHIYWTQEEDNFVRVGL